MLFVSICSAVSGVFDVFVFGSKGVCDLGSVSSLMILIFLKTMGLFQTCHFFVLMSSRSGWRMMSTIWPSFRMPSGMPIFFALVWFAMMWL